LYNQEIQIFHTLKVFVTFSRKNALTERDMERKRHGKKKTWKERTPDRMVAV
jgi:hypothetical protein